MPLHVPAPGRLPSLVDLARAAALGAALAACAGAPPAAPPRDEPGMAFLSGGAFWSEAPSGPTDAQGSYGRIGPYFLDRRLVTVAEYAACVKAGRCTPAAATVEGTDAKRSERDLWSSRCNQDRADRQDHPVNCVDAAQAEAYCAFAGKRLPTEREWEWAARNGEAGTEYPWGKGPPGDRACWNGEGSEAGKGKRDATCPVGSHPSGDSQAGVADLTGNVWQWTSSKAAVQPDSNGRGGSPGRALRGGGWNASDPRAISSAGRSKAILGGRAADIGLRCAKSP